MEEEKIKDTINDFLNGLEEKELLLYHDSNLIKNYKRNITRLDFSDSQISAIRKISSAIQNQNLKLTPDELFGIELGITLGNLIINLEDMKIKIFDFVAFHEKFDQIDVLLTRDWGFY